MSEDRENSLPADRQAVWLYFIHKVFPKRQPASERPVLFAEGGKPVDNPAFDERAKGRAPFYTHEMPQAEHQTAHYDADKAAGTVAGGFEFADIHMEMGSIPPYRLYIGFCAVLRISILYAVIGSWQQRCAERKTL